MATQLLLALVLLNAPLLSGLFSGSSAILAQIESATFEASRFLFGYLVGGADTPFEMVKPEHDGILSFRIFPLIIVLSALSALFYHLGIIPFVIKTISKPVRKFFGLSSLVAFGASASLYFGVVEIPILLKPYLSKLNRAKLFTILTCTMATVSGTVLVLYVSVLESALDDPLVHLVTASFLSIPAALAFAHIMIPRTDELPSQEHILPQEDQTTHSPLEALLNGTMEGVRMVVFVAATILTFFAIVNLCNAGLGALHDGLTLQSALGTLGRPLLWLVGLEWSETKTAAPLLGTKLILNEFVAFLEMAKDPGLLSPRSKVILSYVFCGFVNLASVGIASSSLSLLMPSRKKEVLSLVCKSAVSGLLATLTTAAVINVFL